MALPGVERGVPLVPVRAHWMPVLVGGGRSSLRPDLLQPMCLGAGDPLSRVTTCTFSVVSMMSRPTQHVTSH